ncbi:MAG: FMN-binding protein [Sphaerochaeta sp.]|jgi:Na+-transporting NADH:ubiquinone oxidoreductase subunit C|uniref:FMN-binding protein n=1 Tax=unclassified Sphaerochaeta TaxID=2637943 RepID=UPI000EBDFC83|nr:MULTISPECIES: FMN-binding protein [unclassified Sphaerochaeta]MDX9825155.1 FMN-binding protein [Sphaerochaeta sp.]HCU30682.1 FMN-binding protein [Sphaerochaeta sp.]
MSVQKTFYKDRIYPLLFMFLITFFCILLTAGIHLATQDRANANELSFTRKAVLDAAGITYVNTTAGIEEAYLKRVEEADGYFTTSGSDGKRFIIPLEGPGLWGTISIMVGFEEDLQTFTGVAIVSQNETPGLGARIEEPWFTDQFRGKRPPFTLVEEGTATASNEVDAITGATRTSEYFRNLANQAADAAKRIVRGE